MISLVNKKYDLIFVGTSMICVLEAIYQSKKGKSVLMLDNNEGMGGAWRSLDIFGLHDVENAIHYFLPDPNAFKFMKENLNWDLVDGARKYRVFNFPFLGYCKMAYDSMLARFLSKIIMGEYREPNQNVFITFFKLFKSTLLEKKVPSCYVSGGAPEMLNTVKIMLDNSSVKVKYMSQIESIHVDNKNAVVEVEVGDIKYNAESIVFTHGSRISNLSGPKGPVEINEKFHRRPAVHLFVKDSVASKVHECIFTADPLIKYVHEITHITKEAEKISGHKKLFVFALQHEVDESEQVYQSIFKKIKSVGMISKKAQIEQCRWADVYLPTLYDEDLINLKNELAPQVKYLRTEDFARGIGYNVHRWSNVIRFSK